MQTISHKGLNFSLLYSREHIQKVVSTMAQQINQYYCHLSSQQQCLDLVVVCILKGAFMFYSDLVKQISHPHTCEFIKCRSYEGTQSTGSVTFSLEPRPNAFAGKNVLIVDDIHDTGKTLEGVVEKIAQLKPKTIDCAVLVVRPDKPVRMGLRFKGLQCQDFIVGYGLDLDEYLRNLPDIYQKI